MSEDRNSDQLSSEEEEEVENGAVGVDSDEEEEVDVPSGDDEDDEEYDDQEDDEDLSTSRLVRPIPDEDADNSSDFEPEENSKDDEDEDEEEEEDDDDEGDVVVPPKGKNSSAGKVNGPPKRKREYIYVEYINAKNCKPKEKKNSVLYYIKSKWMAWLSLTTLTSQQMTRHFWKGFFRGIVRAICWIWGCFFVHSRQLVCLQAELPLVESPLPPLIYNLLSGDLEFSDDVIQFRKELVELDKEVSE
ncbi:unnamed protein product [Cuscuta campestris]|uniref:Uncharacterized protein n=1 Tax=Cuscuta campestris TaxID=132261 RepID=A0A484KH45_9ASTE|nr:unnamed protein product [Cuscuta campestris]